MRSTQAIMPHGHCWPAWRGSFLYPSFSWRPSCDSGINILVGMLWGLKPQLRPKKSGEKYQLGIVQYSAVSQTATAAALFFLGLKCWRQGSFASHLHMPIRQQITWRSWAKECQSSCYLWRISSIAATPHLGKLTKSAYRPSVDLQGRISDLLLYPPNKFCHILYQESRAMSRRNLCCQWFLVEKALLCLISIVVSHVERATWTFKKDRQQKI